MVLINGDKFTGNIRLPGGRLPTFLGFGSLYFYANPFSSPIKER
jgi:hypothetical protein